MILHILHIFVFSNNYWRTRITARVCNWCASKDQDVTLLHFFLQHTSLRPQAYSFSLFNVLIAEVHSYIPAVSWWLCPCRLSWMTPGHTLCHAWFVLFIFISISSYWLSSFWLLHLIALCIQYATLKAEYLVFWLPYSVSVVWTSILTRIYIHITFVLVDPCSFDCAMESYTGNSHVRMIGQT